MGVVHIDKRPGGVKMRKLERCGDEGRIGYLPCSNEFFTGDREGLVKVLHLGD